MSIGVYVSEITMPKGDGSKLVLQIFPNGEVYDGHGIRLGITNWAEAVPAADVRPVVRGMWTKELHPNVRYNQYKCSICGEFSGHDSEGWIWKPNYCPNCGADMREES